MKCPYCGWELHQIFGDFSCSNNDCDETIRLRGSEEIWAALSATQQKLDKAIQFIAGAACRTGIELHAWCLQGIKELQGITEPKEE